MDKLVQLMAEQPHSVIKAYDICSAIMSFFVDDVAYFLYCRMRRGKRRRREPCNSGVRRQRLQRREKSFGRFRSSKFSKSLISQMVSINSLNCQKLDFEYCLMLKILKFCLFFMGNDRLSGKQVGSQASDLVTQWLALIQSNCIYKY